MNVRCPNCSQGFNLQAQARGKTLICARCKNQFSPSQQIALPPKLNDTLYSPPRPIVRIPQPGVTTFYAPSGPIALQVSVFDPQHSNGLGIVAMIVGIFALLFVWIPIISLPFACLGAVFGLIGLVTSATRNGAGIAYAAAGMVVSGVALGISGVVLLYSMSWEKSQPSFSSNESIQTEVQPGENLSGSLNENVGENPSEIKNQEPEVKIRLSEQREAFELSVVQDVDRMFPPDLEVEFERNMLVPVARKYGINIEEVITILNRNGYQIE